ncbi:MAG: hypothetical protein HN413_12160 [Chloroflexi bacterium]|jgi:hypothetical protein|nr:hypothetical protein [Chloroflexota bacterium]
MLFRENRFAKWTLAALLTIGVASFGSVLLPPIHAANFPTDRFLTAGQNGDDPTPTPTIFPEEYNQDIEFFSDSFKAEIGNFEQNSAHICSALTNLSYEDPVYERQIEIDEVSQICQQLLTVQEFSQLLASELEYLVNHPATKPEHLEQLLTLHDSYTLTFSQLSSAIESLLNKSPDRQTLFENLVEPQFLSEFMGLLDTTALQKQQIQEQINAIKLGLERELHQALQESIISVQNAVLIGVASLVFLALITTGVFIKTGRITAPILALINAVVALQGNQYRPGLISDVISRKDRLGRAAREFDVFAREVISKETQLQQEVTVLQEKERQERRQKLNFTHQVLEESFRGEQDEE